MRLEPRSHDHEPTPARLLAASARRPSLARVASGLKAQSSARQTHPVTTPLSQLNLPIPAELIEHVADLIARRAFDLLAERMVPGTPWMTTEEAVAYTRIPPGTFEKLAARGRIPSHNPDDGRRKLYHREELDRFLGYARPQPPGYARSLMSADAA